MVAPAISPTNSNVAPPERTDPIWGHPTWPPAAGQLPLCRARAIWHS